MSDLESFDFSQEAECTSCHSQKHIVQVSESLDKTGTTVAEARLCQDCLDALPQPPPPAPDAQGEA